MAKCKHCGASIDPHGWIAQQRGAVVYVTISGTIAYCSADCERAARPAPKAVP